MTSEAPRRMEGDPGEPQHRGGVYEGTPRIGVALAEEILLSAFAQDRRVLEIGTGLGLSTQALARTAAFVFTVDIDPWVQRRVWPTLRDVVCSDQWPDEGQKFGLIFIDADHSEDAVAEDTRRAVARLEPGGMIVFHDWNLPEVRLGALPVLNASGMPFYPLSTQYGMCVAVGRR